MDNPLKAFEEKKLNFFHIKAMFVTGAGMITDGYDLTTGSLVLSLVLSSLNLSLESVSIVLFASIISGNAVGALLFGYLTRKGRTKFYGIDATLMIVGALMQAFVSTPLELALARFVLGIGIGADYVLTPLLMGEYSNRKDRGKLMGLAGGFMWIVGAIFSTLATLLALNFFPANVAWRIALASGALPALFVLYERTRMPETPHYLAFVKGDIKELKEKYGVEVGSLGQRARLLLRSKKLLVPLSLAALSWYLYDVVSYSEGFFGPNEIAEFIGVSGIVFSLIVNAGFSLPFNFFGAVLSDKVGRKVMQAIGFLGMGIPLFLFPFFDKNLAVALVLFGLSNSFSSIGPGNIIAYWGVEMFPAAVRGLTQSITVLGGRLGVITTTLLFPILLESWGVPTVIVMLGILAMVATGITLTLKEMKGKSLSEVEREYLMDTGEFTAKSAGSASESSDLK